jgi:hypothetical protein
MQAVALFFTIKNSRLFTGVFCLQKRANYFCTDQVKNNLFDDLTIAMLSVFKSDLHHIDTVCPAFSKNSCRRVI